MKEKTIAYDMVPEMKIRLEDGRVVTLAELEPMVEAAGRLFATAPWSRNPNPRPTRILVSFSPVDGLVLFDLKTRISHRWAERRPLTWDPTAFAELLKALPYSANKAGRS